MKKRDVPQDKSNLESTNSKELCYAVNEDGEYTTAHSSGWAPKTIALDNAIADINERIENAKQNVLNEKSSPLEYYMEVHKMDIGILASYAGLWTWRVKRHFKPKVFNKLSNKILQKYADVFEITIEELKNIKHGN
ncbi:hypothetical protein Q4566_00130 [Tamlana sp. 2_MG-2023]|uniref:hypothetical protein n=1 Tax=unclassified Tamlana TaxID=2614803 RepID=UPI0026E3D49E|nr:MULTISPECIES: hypothetical protein [unclassified Tamlana]MDO6758588.1 hypothetical protein [Tamlana sp. 2_MG-2023]MDO6789287.1 hypothetical protein [Tamlana sp. 1_MG-2023]